MKKIVVFLLLLILPVTAFALPAVTELELSNEKNVITFKGETEDGSVAVMCKLYNSKDEEIDLLSTEVNENKFEGTFTVTKNDTYTVYCANYEGGDIVKKSVTVKDIANPKTGDNIVIYISLAVVSLMAIILIALKFKNSKKN